MVQSRSGKSFATVLRLLGVAWKDSGRREQCKLASTDGLELASAINFRSSFQDPNAMEEDLISSRLPAPPLLCPRPPPPPLQPRVPALAAQAVQTPTQSVVSLVLQFLVFILLVFVLHAPRPGQGLQGPQRETCDFVAGLLLAAFSQLWARSLSSGANPSSTSSCAERRKAVHKRMCLSNQILPRCSQADTSQDRLMHLRL